MHKPLTLIVLLASLSLPALADQNDAIIGSLIGAAAGASIGHHHHGRDGAVVGAALGGAFGAALASRSGQRDVVVQRPYYYRSESVERVVYNEPTERVIYSEPVERVVYHQPVEQVVYQQPVSRVVYLPSPPVVREVVVREERCHRGRHHHEWRDDRYRDEGRWRRD
ncbi:YMGG-like glycine zipper-containing protein [Chitinimonas sp.]|uniref:YMGG-like glycine zipper-containing protein n=1 Tax=Chitinimonas sp. TaxID=1934313 RepID=UPI0035AE810E